MILLLNGQAWKDMRNILIHQYLGVTKDLKKEEGVFLKMRLDRVFIIVAILCISCFNYAYKLIRRVNSNVVVSILAGNESNGYIDGIGKEAKFCGPAGIAINSSNIIYVADSCNNRIRKITPSGIVTTFAGSGQEGAKDGIGKEASFHYPNGIAISKNGVIYVADTLNHKIRKITPEGVVSTLAGSGLNDNKDGIASEASFVTPSKISVDKNDNIYVLDFNIRKITLEGVVSTVVDQETRLANGKPLIVSSSNPGYIVVDDEGIIYLANTFGEIMKISQNIEITPFANLNPKKKVNNPYGYADYNRPAGITIDSHRNIYTISREAFGKIDQITQDGRIETIIDSEINESIDKIKFGWMPYWIAIGNDDTIYVTDTFDNKIIKITRK